jgi:hypothetical protein
MSREEAMKCENDVSGTTARFSREVSNSNNVPKVHIGNSRHSRTILSGIKRLVAFGGK